MLDNDFSNRPSKYENMWYLKVTLQTKARKETVDIFYYQFYFNVWK
jgi:hypothetical protein